MWKSLFPAMAMAAEMLFSSMFMWKVSSMSPTLSRPVRGAQVEALLDGVDKVGLEAVQGLYGQADAALAGVIGRLAQAFDRPRPLLVSLVGREQAGLARGRVHGAGHMGRADGGGQVDAALQVGHTLGPAGRVLVRHVPVRSERPAHRHLHPGAGGGLDERPGAEEGRVFHAHLEDLEADVARRTRSSACPRR